VWYFLHLRPVREELLMYRVIHFEIHVENPERAMRFYEGLFGWKFQAWAGEDYWLIHTGPASEPGINGGMIRRRGPIDGQAVIAYICTIRVPDLDRLLTVITAQGGQIAHPKMPVPGVGWLAYAKDTEGNIFGMMQEDPHAK
jgi:predicted enzyme related to lactoylglutathione lyase